MTNIKATNMKNTAGKSARFLIGVTHMAEENSLIFYPRTQGMDQGVPGSTTGLKKGRTFWNRGQCRTVTGNKVGASCKIWFILTSEYFHCTNISINQNTFLLQLKHFHSTNIATTLTFLLLKYVDDPNVTFQGKDLLPYPLHTVWCAGGRRSSSESPYL